MTYVMVDVESDGPVPGLYSMVSFGAVIVEPELDRTFYAELHPISDQWMAESLAVCKFTREQTLEFEEPKPVLERFEQWIEQETRSRRIFISDNNGFDWGFINWYFWNFLGRNPFGYYSANLGSLYKGMVRNVFESPKELLGDVHYTHNALDDAVMNAQALLKMKEDGLEIQLGGKSRS